MTKESLEAKKESLTKSLDNLLQQQAQVAEQITMHRGALQYNEMLLKELSEEAEAAKAAAEAKPELKAVEAPAQ